MLSAEKRYLGDENVPTLLHGTARRPGAFLDGRGRATIDGYYVVEQHDNLDEILTRTLDGPFLTEQEAERVAGWRRVVDEETGRIEYAEPIVDAPELQSGFDENVIAATWPGEVAA